MDNKTFKKKKNNERASYFVLINTAHLPTELEIFMSVKNLVLRPRAPPFGI